ncbi:MAG: D-sedoheptulose 7-phosphate isomerase [Bacteroidales bacterium]|nr:D-sedoheptulose 7-phosphate isomerase [Bacteroidales bacterium]
MKIKGFIKEAIALKEQMLKDEVLLYNIQKTIDTIVACYNYNGKVLLCGNGGSAADAQHIAAELTGRFTMERKPLYAEALHTNTSYITAVANDYGFDKIYARILESNSINGDVLLAFSTSGNSPNILEACKVAKNKSLTVIGFTGKHGGKMNDLCDLMIKIPSDNTARIQECHILVGHIICEIVEKKLFDSWE